MAAPMIQFRLFDFPVTVQPWLFITALLIGPRDLTGAAIWVPVVFAGILAHELGHAFAARSFGLEPAIVLHGFGGATMWRGGASLSTARQIAVTAAGPAVGIGVGLATIALILSLRPESPLVSELMNDVVWVNLGWGVLNLLPVLPLDGGVIVTALAVAAVGPSGRRAARVVSIFVCVALAVAALMAGWWWSVFIMILLAIANVQALHAEGRQPRPPAP